MLDNDVFYSVVGKALLSHYSVIDKEGRYTFLRQGFNHIWSYPEQEIKGANFKDFIHPEDLPAVLDQLENSAPGKMQVFLPCRFRLITGEYKWIEATVINMLADSAVQGYLVSSKDITSAVEASNIREKITTSHANFFAKHPFGILHMSMDGMVDMINQQLTKDLGYRLINLQGQSLQSFFLPKYRRKVFQMFHKARLHGEAETFDLEVYTISGQSLHVNLTIVPVVYGGETIEIYGVVKNITDRVTLQENLRKISIVADKTINGVLISNAEGMIEWVNNGFFEMSGYRLDEALGKYPGDLLRSNPAPEVKLQMYEQLSKGLPFKKEILCQKKDGTTYWNLIEVTPVLDKYKNLDKTISIHTDITERKKAEEDLKLIANDLYKHNKELQQFGYIVSHNLRSPVANIMGIANLLELDKHDPETVDKCIRDLKTSISSLDTVIRDLSKILSVTDNTAILKKEVIDVSDLLDNLLTDLNDLIVASDSRITLSVFQKNIFTHKAYLYSVFYNLLSNAIKYRSADAPVIDVSIRKSLNSVIIRVSDNGIGIDLEKHADDLFKPYKRFSAGIVGKGLGLFLVKSHVEALNGKIFIESKVEEGTTITIMLHDAMDEKILETTGVNVLSA